MTISLQADTPRPVTAMRVMVNGELRPVAAVSILRAGVLRKAADFRPAFTAQADPDYVRGTRPAGRTGPVFTASTTAMVTGGTSPFTYSWQRISGDEQLAPASPANATTSFTTRSQGDYETVFRCTIGDATGKSATTDVIASITDLS